MTTKQYLGQIAYLDEKINNKVVELEQLRSLATNITSCNNGDRVQTSVNKEKMASIVAKMIDMENEILEMLENLVDTRGKIIKQVEGMDNESYGIIFSVCISQNSISEYARKNNYARSGAYTKYEVALKKFEKKYGKTYLNI